MFPRWQPLHPEHFAGVPGGENEFPANGGSDLSIHKNVLQLGGLWVAQGLKPVAGLPVPQNDSRADSLCVQQLLTRHRGRSFPHRTEGATKRQRTEMNQLRAIAEFNSHSARLELGKFPCPALSQKPPVV